MVKRFAIVAALVAFAITEMAVFGCNSILGNADGILFDAGPTTTTALECDSGTKACAGICASTQDPAVGCSGQCSACQTPPNALAGCTLENDSFICGIKSCNDQYLNCDDSGADGCETHVTTRANCGACQASCTQKFCEPKPSGDGYECSDTCDAPNTTCGDAGSDAGVECTSLQTDNDNCGACGTACAVTNGAGFCDGGNCETTCNANYFLCNGVCAFATSQLCGKSCAPCPTGSICDTTVSSGTYGTCIATSCSEGNTTCGPTCSIDCTLTGDTCVNGNCTTHVSGCQTGECSLPDGGCTTDLSTSPNCGACGVSCDDVENLCCPGEDIGPTNVQIQGGKPIIVQYQCQSDNGLGCNP
jgi:hypothetical protein